MKTGENAVMYPITTNCNPIFAMFADKTTKIKGTNKWNYTISTPRRNMFREYARKDMNFTENYKGGGFY